MTCAYNNLNRPKVLIVDDEPVVLESIRKVLEYLGMQPDFAEDVSSARRRIADDGYAALIVDIMMPGEQGDILLGEVISHSPGTPVVITSGYATVEMAFNNLREGAFEFLPKPFSFEELSAVAARLKRFTRLSDDVRRSAFHNNKTHRAQSSDRFCLGGHCWINLTAEKTVRIGVGSLVALSVGRIVEIKLPFVGDQLNLGQYHSFLIDEDGYEFFLRMPVSGRVVDVARLDSVGAEFIERVLSGLEPLVTIVPTDLENDLCNLIRCTYEPLSVNLLRQ